jgi:hypothetical protein
MNKLIIPIIGLTVAIIIGSVGFMYFPATKQTDKTANLISSIVSSQSYLSTSSKSEITSVKKSFETVNLDRNNLPKHIKEYVNCPTKGIKSGIGKITHYGGFYIDQNNITQYRCPPKMEDLYCKYNIVFVKDYKGEFSKMKTSDLHIRPYQNNAWNCDQMYAIDFVSKFAFDPCDANTSERNLTPEGYIQMRIDDSTCFFYFPQKKEIDQNLLTKKVEEINEALTNRGENKYLIKKLLILN